MKSKRNDEQTARARRLAAALADMGHEISHTQALSALAKADGARNRHVSVSEPEADTTALPPTATEWLRLDGQGWLYVDVSLPYRNEGDLDRFLSILRKRAHTLRKPQEWHSTPAMGALLDERLDAMNEMGCFMSVADVWNMQAVANNADDLLAALNRALPQPLPTTSAEFYRRDWAGMLMERLALPMQRDVFDFRDDIAAVDPARMVAAALECRHDERHATAQNLPPTLADAVASIIAQP